MKLAIVVSFLRGVAAAAAAKDGSLLRTQNSVEQTSATLSNNHRSPHSSAEDGAAMMFPMTDAGQAPYKRNDMHGRRLDHVNCTETTLGCDKLCMNAVYQDVNYGGIKGDLGCTAKEVQAVADRVDGPEFCEIGDQILVNVTANITFNAARYDFSAYTFTGDNPEMYAPIEKAALFGTNCSHIYLTEVDTANGIKQLDTDPDTCYDVEAKSVIQLTFEENLQIPCASTYGSSNLALLTCFGWYQNAGNPICNRTDGLPVKVYPGTSSKCKCVGIELPIRVRTIAPSMQPSEFPSELPSSTPSELPSAQPSGMPSESPSEYPSSIPSDSPSEYPSSIPSENPSEYPSSVPSENPSEYPSSIPSENPSEYPSSIPSVNPSESPSSIPSENPSEYPSSIPSELPSESPSSIPSENPSESPSSIPSENPTSQPSSVPSLRPTLVPSDAPSESLFPTYVPACDARAVNEQPPDYEEIGCNANQLDHDNPINQCCETSSNVYGCTTCGSCAGANVAGNPAAPGQILKRLNSLNQTCCSYQNYGRGTLYFRNGTSTGESCDGKDDASCCKVGNGNNYYEYACFYTADDDSTMPENIANLDACVCALLSVNINNDGDLSMLGPNCKSRMPSAAPSESAQPSLSPSTSFVPTQSSRPSMSPSASSVPSMSLVPTPGEGDDPEQPTPPQPPQELCSDIDTRQVCNKSPLGCKWHRVDGCLTENTSAKTVTDLAEPVMIRKSNVAAAEANGSTAWAFVTIVALCFMYH